MRRVYWGKMGKKYCLYQTALFLAKLHTEIFVDFLTETQVTFTLKS